MALGADVSKGAEVAAAVGDVVRRFGRIDILVNNVAISDAKTILDITEEEWDRVIAVTLKSQFLMAQAVARQMVAQGPGGPHRHHRLNLRPSRPSPARSPIPRRRAGSPT